MADDRRRRSSKQNQAALMGAVGAGMVGFSQWYDREQQLRAEELRQQRIMELQERELQQGSRRLDIVEKQGQQAEARAQRVEVRDATNAFLEDVKGWKEQYLGTGEDAKLRAQAWKRALDDGFFYAEPEEAAEIASNIASSFGTVTSQSGRDITLSQEELLAGLASLRAHAELRGLTPEQVSDAQITAMITDVFKVADKKDEEKIDPLTAGAGAGGEEAGVDEEDTGVPLMNVDPNSLLTPSARWEGDATRSWKGAWEEWKKPRVETQRKPHLSDLTAEQAKYGKHMWFTDPPLMPNPDAGVDLRGVVEGWMGTDSGFKP